MKNNIIEGLIAAPLYLRLMEAYARGDLAAARAWQATSQAMWDTGVPPLPASKVVMRLVGVDCGQARLPFAPVSAADEARLRTALEAVGFADWCSK